MTEQEEGLSKNEQKKRAKKAAKAAAKADKKQANAEPAAPKAVATSKTTTTQQAPPYVMYNVSNDCDASLKAVWSCLVFGDVSKLKTASSKSKEEDVVRGPRLTLGDAMVMGGNGMAKAFSSFSPEIEVDEWCEWERTQLRKLSPPKKALEHLSHTLQAKHYLVGHALTVADICVLVTLHSMDDSVLPQAVQDYIKTHSKGYELAKEHVEKLVEQQQSSSTSIDINNPNVTVVVTHVFQNVLEELFGQDLLKCIQNTNFVVRATSPKFGDFQCSAAMALFAALKKSGSVEYKSPHDVAHIIVTALSSGDTTSILQDLSVQGPGFVMCRVSSQFLESHVNTLLKTGTLPKPHVESEICLVDFSSPNIAKEMHVGHLRSTIIGEAVCRILEFVGHDVKRVNHVGDWGTQFGMLIEFLKQEYPDFHTTQPNITDLTQFYKSAKERFDENADFKKASQINVVKLQSGDAECMELWQLLCNVSRLEFEKVYKRLDITVEECGESFYNDLIPPVIEEFEKAGLVSVEEGGAKCVFVDGFKIPLMLQKSDGGYGYDSTDMAALSHRLRTLQAKRIICITDFSQGDHFKMCFAAAEQIGWKTPQHELQHIGFGTVQGQDGKRFKTRSGDTVRLVDLLDEAVDRMETSLKERIAEGRANISLDEVHDVAEAIGYGAVKYFDLRRNPTTNYKFSYDQMLDTKGNTAVYLLYAHARLQSIMAKAETDYGIKMEELLASDDESRIVLGHASERNLAFHLQLFADTMQTTLEDLYPYHVCEYLYNTAIAASEFVTQCKVLGSPEMKSRLLLCHATTLAMRECFQLLGIRPVMRI